MTLLGFLIAWGNAPFTVAASVAITFALLQASGVLGLLAGGDDHDADVHADVDHDADMGGDHELDADADADADADGDSDADDAHGLGAVLMVPLGIGKLPFSLIWQVFAVVFAVTGLATNARFFPAVPPLVSLAWTLPLALVAGYAVVALLARLLGPVLSSRSEDATRRSELVGQLGVVISSAVTEDFGEVRIRDKSGHDVRVICKLAQGSPRVALNESVVVVDYDDVHHAPTVAPLEDDDVGDESLASSKRAADHTVRP